MGGKREGQGKERGRGGRERERKREREREREEEEEEVRDCASPRFSVNSVLSPLSTLGM